MLNFSPDKVSHLLTFWIKLRSNEGKGRNTTKVVWFWLGCKECQTLNTKREATIYYSIHFLSPSNVTRGVPTVLSKLPTERRSSIPKLPMLIEQSKYFFKTSDNTHMKFLHSPYPIFQELTYSHKMKEFSQYTPEMFARATVRYCDKIALRTFGCRNDIISCRGSPHR